MYGAFIVLQFPIAAHFVCLTIASYKRILLVFHLASISSFSPPLPLVDAIRNSFLNPWPTFACSISASVHPPMWQEPLTVVAYVSEKHERQVALQLHWTFLRKNLRPLWYNLFSGPCELSACKCANSHHLSRTFLASYCRSVP
jgi:hypothetical protein